MNDQKRALMPDYLRLFALFGIAVVNVQFIAFTMLGDFTELQGDTAVDAVAMWLVNGLAMLKTYGLFSFMFGVGLGFLMRAAEQRGIAFGRIYRNRMIGLCLFGFFHGCLFFPGDILVIYSITGSILYLFRNWSVARLVKVGAVLLIVQLFVFLPLALASGEMPPEIISLEQSILSEGGFSNAIIFRSIAFAFTVLLFPFLQGISALGWFCLGLAAVKSGMIDNAKHPVWQLARRWCLGPGIVLSLLGAALWQWGPAKLGVAFTVVVAPLATLGYLGLIAKISRPAGPVMTKVLAAGGSSLSVYLGQSIILSSIFSAYGLGLWSAVDRITATAIAVFVTALLIGGLVLWRLWFSLGPFEWLLRRITYAGLKKE